MSIPLRITPRPVKKLRAAPTAKWESMAMANAVHAAAGPLSTRKGATGMSAPTAVDAPVTHPSLNGVACAPDLELLAHLLVQGPLRVAHHLGGHLASDPRLDALGLIDQGDLFLLHFGHDADFFFLHGDLVVVHLLLALGREVPRRAHRERVRDHAGESREQHDVRRDGGADHARHETKVG